MKFNYNLNFQLLYLSIIISLLNFTKDISAQKLVVGYYPEYASGTISPQDIRYDIISNVIHCFAWPDSNGNIETYNGMLSSTLIHEAHQAGKKVSISFGGGGQSEGLAAVAIDSLKRKSFVNNAVGFITNYGYDGIDIDWEFPDSTNGSTFTSLVKELREELDKIDNSLLLSIAVTPGNWHGRWIEYEKMIDNVDWFSMMAYDFNGSWSSLTGHNAPIYKYLNNTDGSGDEGIEYLINERNIPKEKIVYGIPFFGKVYNSNGLNKPWINYSEEDAVLKLSYRDIQDSLNSNYNYIWDNTAKVPYFINSSENRFISFDDTASVRLKTEYVIEKNLRGVMVWEITQDKLADGNQPLLEQINKTLKSNPTDIAGYNLIPNDYKLFNNFLISKSSCKDFV